MDKLIQKLFENLKEIITEGFEDDLKEIIETEYLGILKNRYYNLEISEDKLNAFYEKIYMLEKNEWSNIPLNMKKHILLKDEALNEIINITSNAFKCAKEKLYNGDTISIEMAEKDIIRLKELYELVAEYNKKLADWHLSEGIMDLKYSSGQTENMSLRIGHIK